MRIGLYGLPTSGKTYILDRIKNIETLSGSKLLKEMEPDFDNLSEYGKSNARIKLAANLTGKDNFIMDGHYSFGDNVVFTAFDGLLYDVFLYLYVKPEIIKERMEKSDRNNKYLSYDIDKWQRFEIESLRNFCHTANKDFYVIDNPTEGFFSDMSVVINFIDEIISGYSCVNFARKAVASMPCSDVISLFDGDRTYIKEDSSSKTGYKTHIFDNNFYSGFQAWCHNKKQRDYLQAINYQEKTLDELNLTLNNHVIKKGQGNKIILTTGYYGIWKQISDKYNIPIYHGPEMCSDTKYFIAKFLQKRGSKVFAFGDSMNDYYMLKQADKAYLVLKDNNKISSSLNGKNLEGIEYVYN